MATPISQNLTDQATSSDEAERLVRAIDEKGWWQGSIIAGIELEKQTQTPTNSQFLVIASQTCNIYNGDFGKVPFVEFVLAKQLEQRNGAMEKGDNPRILHVEATSATDALNLELEIQPRIWLPRRLLAELPISPFRLRDFPLDGNQSAKKITKWNDNFAGWLARSYTRVTLPDEFNRALKDSRLDKALETKLTKRPDEIYGIYLNIGADSDPPWEGVLGEMPPPYLLSIEIVVFEHVDAELLRLDFIKYVFETQIQDPVDSSLKITRGALARRHGIRIIPEAVMVKSEAEITLKELRQLVRFSIVDHLSDSSMATAE